MRRESGLARIDVQHFSIGLKRFLDLTAFLESTRFDEMRQRLGLTRPLGLQNEVPRRLGIKRIVLPRGSDWRCRSRSHQRDRAGHDDGQRRTRWRKHSRTYLSARVFANGEGPGQPNGLTIQKPRHYAL